jgi:type II secretory pathway component PulC
MRTAKILILSVLTGPAFAEPARAPRDEARCVPHVVEGSLDGYRCTEISPGSYYERAGLRNGDVIRKIDGEALTDPLLALEKLGRLSSAKHGKVALRIERDGHEIDQVYDPESVPNKQVTR